MNKEHKIKFKIKELLDERGKSLYWLSKDANVPYPTLHKIANNKTDGISFAVLDKLCDALGCEPCDLIIKTKPLNDK